MMAEPCDVTPEAKLEGRLLRDEVWQTRFMCMGLVGGWTTFSIIATFCSYFEAARCGLLLGTCAGIGFVFNHWAIQAQDFLELERRMSYFPLMIHPVLAVFWSTAIIYDVEEFHTMARGLATTVPPLTIARGASKDSWWYIALVVHLICTGCASWLCMPEDGLQWLIILAILDAQLLDSGQVKIKCVQQTEKLKYAYEEMSRITVGSITSTLNSLCDAVVRLDRNLRVKGKCLQLDTMRGIVGGGERSQQFVDVVVPEDRQRVIDFISDLTLTCQYEALTQMSSLRIHFQGANGNPIPARLFCVSFGQSDCYAAEYLIGICEAPKSNVGKTTQSRSRGTAAFPAAEALGGRATRQKGAQMTSDQVD